MTITRFVDGFWGADFVSTAGFDVLSKRMKEGKQVCKDLEDFLRQRSKIEEDYSKSLQKLARTTSSKEEIGTLRSSLDMMKAQLERVAQSHLDFSNKLCEEANRTTEFLKGHRDTRKKVEESVIKHQQNKRNMYKKVMELKKSYEVKCRDADSADLEVKAAHMRATLPQKDMEKLVRKQSQSKMAANQADDAYRASVASLETVRQSWEKEMVSCCDIFQQLEIERIQFLRNRLWIYTNLSSHTCVEEDEYNEEVRISLDRVDIEGDIISFINDRKTGTERPAKVGYHSYYEKHRRQFSDSEVMVTIGKDAARRATGIASGPMPKKTSPIQYDGHGQKMAPPIPTSSGTSYNSASLGRSTGMSNRPPQPIPPPLTGVRLLPARNKLDFSDEIQAAILGRQTEPSDVSEYAEISGGNDPVYSEVERAAETTVVVKIAQQNYTAKSNNELSLRKGDVVYIMGEVNSDTFDGRLETGSRRAEIPKFVFTDTTVTHL